MKKLITIAATAGMLVASGATAQVAQQGVVGASGDAEFSLQVQGADGVTYNCRPDIVTRNGVQVRECVQAGAGGSVFAEGTGLTSAGGGLVTLVLVAAVAGGSSSTTTSTSGSVSDARLKSDIVQIGTTLHNLPLYQFRYTGGTQTYTGVMAQDVLAVVPEAVVTMENGFYGVNYEMLGIEMTPVD